MNSRSRQCNKCDAEEPRKPAPGFIHRVALIIVLAVGIASIVMVGALAMINLDNTTAMARRRRR